MNEEQRSLDTTTAILLAEEAVEALRAGDPADAGHRLLDAAGLAYGLAGGEGGSRVGIQSPTGRGFRLDASQALLDSLAEIQADTDPEDEYDDLFTADDDYGVIDPPVMPW